MNRAPRLMAIRGPSDDSREWAGRLARAGVDCLQLRDKSASDLQVFERCRLVVEALSAPASIDSTGVSKQRSASPIVLVNRRPDIALAAGADGVHLPAAGLPISLVRRAFGEAFVIGRSTHSLDEVDRAQREGADYVVFGPIYATPEKLEFGAPLGLRELTRAAALGIPVLAIGGITDDRLEEVVRAGASGAAAIRLFEDPTRASAVVERARDLFDRIGGTASA